MGLKDRFTAAKRHMYSPITVWMADQPYEKLVHAGQPATVLVDVRGEDDGTAERVEVWLQMLVSDVKEKWPLGEVPAKVGLQSLDVTIPVGLAPSCAKYVEYSFQSELHRTKGFSSTAGARVDVVARAEDAFWPDGPRAGQDDGGAATISIDVDTPTVDAGGAPLTGTVTLTGRSAAKPASVVLTFGASVTQPYAPKGETKTHSKVVAKVELEHALALGVGESRTFPFSIDVPTAVPPTLHNGGKSTVVGSCASALGMRPRGAPSRSSIRRDRRARGMPRRHRCCRGSEAWTAPDPADDEPPRKRREAPQPRGLSVHEG